jgi:heat shock protein HslJ
MKKLFLVAFIAIVFVGCGTTSPQISDEGSNAAQGLEGNAWLLDKINDKKMRLAIMGNEAVGVSVITFTNDMLSGNTGTNQFKASYKTDGDTLSTSQFVTTRAITYHKILANNERDILGVLGAEGKTYTIDNKGLTIRSDNGTLFYKRYYSLAHTSWVLAKAGNKQLDGKGLGRPPLLEFENDKISGFLGVSMFDANYKLSQNNLKISNIKKSPEREIDTKEAKTLESDVTSIISGTPALQIPVPTVLILGSSNNNLTFRRAVFADVLHSAKWELVSFKDAVIEGKKPNIEFSKDGTIYGNGGVNTFNGQYAVEDRKLYITSVISTMMAGTIKAMEIESRYFKALENAEYLEFKDYNTFTIFAEDDELTFRRLGQ